MDASSLREQRRKRILENGRSRMDRILGTVGETQLNEPVIDGLGRSSRFDDAEFVTEESGESLPSADVSKARNVSEDEEEEELGELGAHLSRSSIRHSSEADTKPTAPRSSRQTKESVRKPLWKTFLLDHRLLFAIFFGIFLRLALWLGILPADGNLFPYIVSFMLFFETFAKFLPVQAHTSSTRSRIHAPIPSRIKAACGRLFDDFMVIFCGFVLTHFLLSVTSGDMLS